MKFTQQTIYSISRGAAIAAAGFTVIISSLMIFNYIQTINHDPLDNERLDLMFKELEEDPANQELQQQIRAYDLKIRKIYFVNQWQLKTAGYFLLGSVVILLLSLKTMDAMLPKPPAPEHLLDEHESWLVSSKARQWVAGLGVFLLGSAGIFASYSFSELTDTSADEVSSAPTAEDFLKNWPNFRGPGGIGVVIFDNPPTAWNVESGDGVKWKVEVPKPGFSSPIVWQDRIFLSGGDRQALEVYCFDAGSGELLWKQQVNEPDDNSLKEVKLHHDTGYAAPTMATNGRYVFAIFATGHLVCLDFHGNQIWAQHLGVPENHYGHSSSLLVYENLLIVQYDQSAKAKLLALDVLSGSIGWRIEREIISWSSPIIIDTGDRRELIVTNSEFVESFDPKNGVKFWQVECLAGEHGPSPAYAGGLVIAANEYSSATAIRITGDGAEIAWQFFDELPDAASPLATAEYLFLATSSGVIACVDIKTGEALWFQEFDEGFYSSPIIVGNIVYAIDKGGVVHLFEADKVYKSIGDFALGEKTFSSPAFVSGNLFIRSENYLFCISGTE